MTAHDDRPDPTPPAATTEAGGIRGTLSGPALRSARRPTLRRRIASIVSSVVPREGASPSALPAAVASSAARPALALIALASLAPGTATSLEFECSVPGDTRYLRIDLPGEEHLCEVSVTGGISDERRVMWYADNDSLYCSAKVYELRDKYVDEFSFECGEGIDRDGVDRLSPRHRAILDTQLKSLLARAADGEPDLVVSAVRAVASSALPAGSSLLALQFFLADGTDLVRVVADEEKSWRTLAETRDLAASIPPTASLGVDDAFIGAIDGGGSLDVLTLLARDGAPPCEGRLALQADADGTFVPVAPHLHVCGDVMPTGDDAG